MAGQRSEWVAWRQSPAGDQSNFRPLGNARGQIAAAGQALGNINGLLAATAMEHDLTVATHNTRHFADFGVAILDPRGS